MRSCLFITTQFPYPLDNGGKIGAFNGLSVISANYNVTVLSFSEEMQYVDEGIDYFKNKLPNVQFKKPIRHDIHIRKKPFTLVKVMAKDFLYSLPYVTIKFENQSMYRAIDKQFENGNCYDIVFIDYLNMGIYQNYIQKKYSGQYSEIILKDHNIEFEIVRQTVKNEFGFKKAILNREWKVTKKYEEYCIKNADRTFSVCDDNTEFLKQNNKNAYTMLPTFEMLPKRKQTIEHNILYMGNLSWGANLEGLRWFVDQVMPKIIKKVPDAKLTVVGSGPNKEVFANYGFVNYLGYVKDISHIYDDQKVFVVPLFEGSGIRIKILEAFNNEIAVVSTTLGCGTIGASDKKEIMIADDKEKFAESVIELLLNTEFNKKMVFNSKLFLEKKYSLQARQQEFWETVNGKEENSLS